MDILKKTAKKRGRRQRPVIMTFAIVENLGHARLILEDGTYRVLRTESDTPSQVKEGRQLFLDAVKSLGFVRLPAAISGEEIWLRPDVDFSSQPEPLDSNGRTLLESVRAAVFKRRH